MSKTVALRLEITDPAAFAEHCGTTKEDPVLTAQRDDYASRLAFSLTMEKGVIASHGDGVAHAVFDSHEEAQRIIDEMKQTCPPGLSLTEEN